ncbi:MAG: ribosome maturation factor RimP [Coriobacteriia bacterium]|nr:ribosome maturation factor RimP [Coriobacteriia bacterium]
MTNQELRENILAQLEGEAVNHDLDIVELEIVGASKAPIIRVYIDKLDGEGISIDELVVQNKWISELIEAIDPFAASYELEVSSPGIDRPLRRPQDFIKRVGEDVDLQTNNYEGRKKWSGKLIEANDETFSLEVDKKKETFSYADIKKARLKAKIDFGTSKGKGK